jgi:tryptophan 2,3-dioxygenase
MELTYSNYLKIQELTSLQDLKSENKEHDEMLFIIIHQAYELWFKQILHESEHLCKLFEKNEVMRAAKTINRINTILKVLVHQVDILETMTPLEFLSFRDYLESASGFQSAQFREFEYMLGHKQTYHMKNFEKDSPEYKALKKRLNEPTLWDYFIKCVAQNDYDVPESALKRDIKEKLQANKELHPILVKIYESDRTLALVCEMLMNLDEGLQEWRYRHVKMVERTIGGKLGTGGTVVTEYLKKTLFDPVFPDLWIIRTEFEYVPVK